VCNPGNAQVLPPARILKRSRDSKRPELKDVPHPLVGGAPGLKVVRLLPRIGIHSPKVCCFAQHEICPKINISHTHLGLSTRIATFYFRYLPRARSANFSPKICRDIFLISF
jgi:hypothetical protein